MTETVRQAPLTRVELPVTAHAAKFTDTLEIDQEAHRLYVGDNWSGGVDVFDITTTEPKYLKTIKTRGTFFGIAIAKNVNKVFVGLNTSAVAVIDVDPASAKMDLVIERIDTGGRGAADLLDYDPTHRVLYVANRQDGFLSAIDAQTHQIVKKLDGLNGGLEQPRYNPNDGMVYVTGNTGNVLYQIDAESFTLVETFELDDDCHPNGMALNPGSNQALLACNNRERPHTVIWDLTEKKIAAVIEDSGCGDGATYDAKVDRFFFAASGFNRGPVMGIFGGNPVRFLTNVPTQAGASWVAYDETNNVVYAPAIQAGRPAIIGFPLPA